MGREAQDLRAFFAFLNEHYPECGLRVLDVGARLGLVDEGLRELPALWNLHLEGIEPESAEAARLLADPSVGPYAAVHEVAVSDVIGPRTLHMTALKGCASLYPPNMETLAGHTAASWFAPVGTLEVATTTLDALYADAPPFDFVKLDTQGAEFDVLRGGERLCRAATGISLEVQFHELYEGQWLFPDVHAWMTANGFRLVHLKEESDFYNGEVLEGNCFYVKDPAGIATAEDLLRRVAVALLCGNRRYTELLLRRHAGAVLPDALLAVLLGALELELDGRTLAFLGPHN
jgi:FkbM family methyltransferase